MYIDKDISNFAGKMKWVIVGFIVFIILYLILLKPFLRVWQQEQEGKAALARANQERQILVTQATAEKEAAKERAEAIRIIGEAAQKYPEYRTQEFMGAFAEAVQKENIQQIVYIPTEAGIPMLEAGRIANKDTK